MSMKRSKSRGTGARDSGDSDGGFFSKPKEPEKTWAEQIEGKADTDFTPYAMDRTYALGALVLHSKFGKGVVVEVEGLKVNVLFEDAKRKLGHAQVVS
jgi:hypothetical protein